MRMNSEDSSLLRRLVEAALQPVPSHDVNLSPAPHQLADGARRLRKLAQEHASSRQLAQLHLTLACCRNILLHRDADPVMLTTTFSALINSMNEIK